MTSGHARTYASGTSLTTITTAPVTMSSRDIADLTGKLHKNVIRDIRTMLDELAEDGSNLSHVREEVDSRGYTAAIHLARREVEILLTGYSIPLRAKVIDRLRIWSRRGSLRVFPATSLKPSVLPPIWRTRRKLCVCRTRP